MGVRARIVLYAPSRKGAGSAAKAAFDRIAALEDIMSDYRPTSELMRLCSAAGGSPVCVSKELLDVLVKSQELSRRSGSAFDVTVGPLARLWREAIRTRSLPPSGKLEEARKLVGWRNVVIDQERSTVRLRRRGMQLDLGGIAKGYACDEAIRILKASGVGSALVEMGGDIAVSGPPPGAAGWKVGVANADDADSCVVLANAAVSSSGDTEQYVQIDGLRYSHIVDPHTGVGVTNRTTITVIAPDCTTSDSLATSLCVLGAQAGRGLLESYPGARVLSKACAAARGRGRT